MKWPCDLGFRCPHRCHDDEGLGFVCIHPDIEPEEGKLYGYVEDLIGCPLMDEGPIFDWLLSDRNPDEAGNDPLCIPCMTAFKNHDLKAWIDGGSRIDIRAYGLFWSLSFEECGKLVKDIRAVMLADDERACLSRIEVEFDDEFQQIYIVRDRSSALMINLEDADDLCAWIEKVIA